MTLWILAGNDINFSMAVGLIKLHMPSGQVISGVKKVDVWQHRADSRFAHGQLETEIWWPTDVKMNMKTFSEVCSVIVNMFHCGRRKHQGLLPLLP